MTKREAGKVAARKRIIRFVELCKYPVTNNGEQCIGADHLWATGLVKLGGGTLQPFDYNPNVRFNYKF